jgi:hypothetical protein
MLDHLDRDDGELFDLMAKRLADREQLPIREHMATPTTLRPILENLVHHAQRGSSSRP